MWEQQLVCMLEFVSVHKQVWMWKLSCRKHVDIVVQDWDKFHLSSKARKAASTFYKTNSYNSGSGVLFVARNMS
jgi:hypothetical protein